MADADVITLSDEQIDRLFVVSSELHSNLFGKKNVPQLVGQVREYCIGLTSLGFSLLIYYLF